MKLTVLIDNNTYIDEYYIGAPALSYYIEDENERLLCVVGIVLFVETLASELDVYKRQSSRSWFLSLPTRVSSVLTWSISTAPRLSPRPVSYTHLQLEALQESRR